MEPEWERARSDKFEERKLERLEMNHFCLNVDLLAQLGRLQF